ncbi:hypothetical protein KHA80_01580 [Anaerobacillus sp. HL2]|nr:hypothetical protein KHA80_01580 [Anaerobacillus sp. HL2]
MIDRRIKANLSDIADAINGRIRRHHRDMLEYHWNSMTFFDEQISSIEIKKLTNNLFPIGKRLSC